MKALILAAGEGTRLRPLTLDRPKPMLPIDGRPLLEHIIGWLRHHGITEIAINLHYRSQIIRDCLADGGRLGVQLTYSYEDPILGTAGAARKLAGFLAQAPADTGDYRPPADAGDFRPPADTGDYRQPFVVVYGDVLTDLDLGELLRFHRVHVDGRGGPALTMGLYRVGNPTQVGLVEIHSPGGGRVTRFVEKPPPDQVFSDLANTGLLVVEPGVLGLIPEGEFCDFGCHVVPDMLARGLPVYGWPAPEDTYLIDIGTPEKYARAQQEWPARPASRAGGWAP